MLYDDDAPLYDDPPPRRVGPYDCGGWAGPYGPCGDQECRRCNPQGVDVDADEDAATDADDDQG